VLACLPCWAACKPPKGTDADTRELIPAAASVAFGFEVAPVRDSALGDPLHAAMQADPDMRAGIGAVQACNVDVSQMRATVATSTEAGPTFVVIESPGIGNEDAVRCMEEEGSKLLGRGGGLILLQTRGDVRVLPQEGGGHLIILDADRLAVVDAPWEDAVFSAIATPSARNTDTALAKTLQQVDRGSDLWAALVLSDSDRAGLVDLPGADRLASATFVADLSDGLKLDVGLDTLDAESARTLQQSIRDATEEIEPGLADAGLPPTMLDGLKVESSASRVTAQLVVNRENMPAVVQAMASLSAEP
jgi:hypothetical protein